MSQSIILVAYDIRVMDNSKMESIPPRKSISIFPNITSSTHTPPNPPPYLYYHTAPHLSANQSRSASGFLSYSLLSARYCACSWPNTCAIHANARSMPAETPELVQILPSTTHLALGIQLTRGCVALTCSVLG